MAPPLKSMVVVAPLQEPVPLKSKADERCEAEDESHEFRKQPAGNGRAFKRCGEAARRQE